MTYPVKSILQRKLEQIQARVILDFKIKHYRQIEGFLSPLEAAALYLTASRLPRNSTILEIGSWKGKSTYCLARGLRAGTVIAIDPFNAFGEEESREIYQREKGEIDLLTQFITRMSGLGVMNKIKVLRGYSHEFVGQAAKIDLLFIDGDHSKEGCSFDFLNYSPALSTGGYLLFHDFQPTRRDLGPTWVIENLVIPSQEYKFISLYNSLWLGKKL